VTSAARVDLAEATDRLAALADARGLAWPPGAPGTLARYLAEVVRVSADVNLTGAKDLGAAVEVLGLPSLAVGRAWPGPAAPRRIVDLGSGNGLPGVVAALAWPAARVLLVERRAKKARAIEACVAAAGIADARVAAGHPALDAVPCDGRELLRDRPEVRGAVDLVLARGVGTLAEVATMAAPWLAPGGRIVQWKGADLAQAERRAGERAARTRGLRVLADVEFHPPLPGPGRLVAYGRGA
jgi:16S rRNA (guanine527-N7)-methyltransferase